MAALPETITVKLDTAALRAIQQQAATDLARVQVQIDTQQTQIDTLRAQLATPTLAAAHAEIARLRAGLESLRQAHGGIYITCPMYYPATEWMDSPYVCTCGTTMINARIDAILQNTLETVGG
jgi:hypothetical protein